MTNRWLKQHAILEVDLVQILRADHGLLKVLKRLLPWWQGNRRGPFVVNGLHPSRGIMGTFEPEVNLGT